MSTKKIQIINSVITTDQTLTRSGVAADSKIVGEALANKQPIGDYALNSEVNEVKLEAINASNAYTDEQIESVLIYVNNLDIDALF